MLAFTALGPGGRLYWTLPVTVPAAANGTHPYEMKFHAATFIMWWPFIPSGRVTSGSPGVTIQITEPSGVIDETSTGCVACVVGSRAWYSSDGSVGIYSVGGSGSVTLLVRV
jgi:hypothetical protein